MKVVFKKLKHFEIYPYSFLFCFLISTQVLSVELSELGLFHRCYSQITQSRVKSTDTLFHQVKNGDKKAISACLEVLNKADFTSNQNQTISDITDPVALNVVNNFQKLHASWFKYSDFSVISWPGHNFDLQDIIDPSTPSLYFTRALFKPGTLASDPITTTEALQAVRSQPELDIGPSSKHPKADFLFTNFSFVPTGQFLGVQAVSDIPLVVSNDPLTGKPAAVQFGQSPIQINQTLGGGFLGHQSYGLLSFGTNAGKYQADGGLKMPRRWGQAVFHDLLCRSLPVVREEDAFPYVAPKSSIPFRVSASCVKCHASHDRLSAVVRGQHIVYVGTGDPTSIGEKKRGGNFIQYWPVDQVAEESWPTEPDLKYSSRPNQGVLYFRNYIGQLININVSSVSDLGRQIASQDDYYICLAKRYYQYFLGINVNSGDLKDPAQIIISNQMNELDHKHRETVIQLGIKLKNHQNLKTLISDILNLDSYRQIHFGSGTNNVK